MKRCTICNELLELSNFHKHRRSKDGLRPACKACRSEERKLRYYSHKDKEKEYKTNYYLKNKVKVMESNKWYQEEDPVRWKELRKKIRNNRKVKDLQWKFWRRQTDEVFDLACRMRSLLRNVFNGKGYTKKSKSTIIIGCSYEKLMEWLGPKPCDNPEVDHICPLSQARTEEEVIKLQHYMNFQWLTKAENLKKSDNKTHAGEFLCEILLGRKWDDTKVA